jgi:hypothetical protein
MIIALRRQIACYTDLDAILALVDPCPKPSRAINFTT